MIEDLFKRIGQRLLGQTVSFEDTFTTDGVFYEFGYAPEVLDREGPLHFGMHVDVSLLLNERGGLYYQVNFVRLEEDEPEEEEE